MRRRRDEQTTARTQAAFLSATAAALPAAAADELVLIPDYALFGLIGGEEGIGMLWVMVALFVVLIFPLNALMFKPIFRALDARMDRIAGAMDARGLMDWVRQRL